MLATWGSRKFCTMVVRVVFRDSSSGDDVVRDCRGEVGGDALKDEEAQASA